MILKDWAILGSGDSIGGTKKDHTEIVEVVGTEGVQLESPASIYLYPLVSFIFLLSLSASSVTFQSVGFFMRLGPDLPLALLVPCLQFKPEPYNRGEFGQLHQMSPKEPHDDQIGAVTLVFYVH